MTNPNEPWSNPYGQPGQQPAANPGQYGGPPPTSPPGYGQQPGYAQQPPPGYGQPAGNPYSQPYPATPGYNAYAISDPNRRPGGVIAAAVLSYVQSGFLLLTGIILLATAKTFDDLGASGSGVAEVTLDGIVDIVLGGMFIAGAVMVTSGRTRNVLVAACMLNLVDCIYWGVRAVSGSKALVLLFVVLPVISLCLILTGAVTNWLSTRARGNPGPAGYPSGPTGYPGG